LLPLGDYLAAHLEKLPLRKLDMLELRPHPVNQFQL